MSVVDIPFDDLKKGLSVAPGMYKAEILEYKQETAKDGQSTNHVFTYELENDDKSVIPGRFSSKAMGFVRPFLAALSGKSEKEWLVETAEKLKTAGLTNLPFDGDQCVGKKIGIVVVNNPNPNGGNPYTNIDAYLPYNAVIK